MNQSCVTGTSKLLSCPFLHQYLVREIGASALAEHISLSLLLTESTNDKNLGVTPMTIASFSDHVSPNLIFL
jgi:hypothetical protein